MGGGKCAVSALETEAREAEMTLNWDWRVGL